MDNIPKNVKYPKLYKKAKEIVYKQYEKPSAYRSGALVKKYKELSNSKHGNSGYIGKKTEEGTSRWFEEDWIDMKPFVERGKKVSCGRTKQEIKKKPACRPSKRINKDTPITAQEVLKKHGKEKTLKMIKMKEQGKRVKDWEQ